MKVASIISWIHLRHIKIQDAIFVHHSWPNSSRYCTTHTILEDKINTTRKTLSCKSLLSVNYRSKICRASKIIYFISIAFLSQTIAPGYNDVYPNLLLPWDQFDLYCKFHVPECSAKALHLNSQTQLFWHLIGSHRRSKWRYNLMNTILSAEIHIFLQLLIIFSATLSYKYTTSAFILHTFFSFHVYNTCRSFNQFFGQSQQKWPRARKKIFTSHEDVCSQPD